MTSTQHYEVVLESKEGSRVSFSCPQGMTIFRAAQQAGYHMTVGCTAAGCAICRSDLLKGEVKSTLSASPYQASDPAAREDGCILVCATTPLNDIVVKPRSPWFERKVT
jgi:methane monooxygenase component C